MSKLAHSHQPTMDRIEYQRALCDLGFKEAFGLAMRNRRHNLGYTQADVAKRLGKSRTSITNMELGRQGMSLETGLKLMNILHMSVGDLLGQRDIMYV